MTSRSKKICAYWSIRWIIVKKCNITYHKRIEIKPLDVKLSIYINLDPKFNTIRTGLFGTSQVSGGGGGEGGFRTPHPLIFSKT